MVLPLIPIAIAGLGGAGGFGLSQWLSKKEMAGAEIHAPKEHYAPQIQIVEAEPYQHYAPQVQFTPVTTYGYVGPTTIIESPGARVKKEQIMDVVSQPTQRGAWEFPVELEQKATRAETEGVNITYIAIIAAIGVIGYGLLKKKKK